HLHRGGTGLLGWADGVAPRSAGATFRATAVLRSHRSRLHPGGNCADPAICAFLGASHLRPDGGGIPDAALEWRRQRGIEALARLGFLMGMPFPTGLRAIVTKGRSALQTATLEQFSEPPAANSAIEWAWAMNAASSVLGSALAMVVAIHSGLNAALACAAGAYLSAAALTALWQRS